MTVDEYAHGCVIEIERDNRRFEVHFSEPIHDDRLGHAARSCEVLEITPTDEVIRLDLTTYDFDDVGDKEAAFAVKQALATGCEECRPNRWNR